MLKHVKAATEYSNSGLIIPYVVYDSTQNQVYYSGMNQPIFA